MTRTALILAAHGSRRETANALVREHAARVRALGLFDEVAVAFHRGKPGFAEVLDQIDASVVTVVPLMTSQGYYSEGVLPRDLAANPRASELRLRITPPVGTHPAIAFLVAKRIDELLRGFGLRPERTYVAIVGHGTPRNQRSRRATEDLAKQLAAATPCRSVNAFLVNEPPGVEQILSRSSEADVVIIPFLIGGGSHGVTDIAERLGLEPDIASSAPPFEVRVGERRIVLDRAVGFDPGIMDAIVALASSKETPRPRARHGVCNRAGAAQVIEEPSEIPAREELCT